MNILTRYLIRAHIGPFLFAFVTVTGLLFLNAVAARLEDLAGRGLEWDVIQEFMIFSLPHVIALTFPMSILIAALYACSDMTEHNEIAAIAGGGIHPARIMVPLIGIGILMSGAMFYFNDQILPESNHRLSALIQDVATKSPTFELRESIVNPIQTSDETHYFLRARSIDPGTNHLEDIDIYDLSLPGETRTIVAKEGEMAFTEDGSDLYLTLYDGTVYLVSESQPGDFQHMTFGTQILPMRGVGTELQRGEGNGVRSEREMTSAMLQVEVDIYKDQLANVIEKNYDISMKVVETSLGSGFPTPTSTDEAPSPASTTDGSSEPLETGISDPTGANTTDTLATTGVPISMPRAVSTITTDGVLQQLPLPGYVPVRDETVSAAASEHRQGHVQWLIYSEQVAGHQVEIYKKHAIAFACLIFVLLAPPLALRFPRGGVGMVITASLGIFFLYWMGLIGGERLADDGKMDPLLAMWAPNLLLLIPALFLISRMAGTMASNRGGAWDEISFWIREFFGRPFRRSQPRPAELRSGGEG